VTCCNKLNHPITTRNQKLQIEYKLDKEKVAKKTHNEGIIE
jgi:hypothetical protein